MLLFVDGFEHYGTDETNMLAGLWAAFSVTPELSTTFARTGTYSLWLKGRTGSPEQTCRFALGSTNITVGVGYGIYCPNLPSSNALFYTKLASAAAADILSVIVQSDGSICVRKGDETGAVVDISDAVITAGTFHHIEFKTVFDTVAGAVEVRVNGVTVLMIGGLNLGAVGAASVIFTNDLPTGIGYYIDDVFAWNDVGSYNNDFLGAQRVLTVYPAADTAQADFTKNGAGTGIGCINQVAPDGDTTYLGSAVVGDKSEFTLPTLPPELVTIAGVFVPVMGKLDAAGIGNIKPSMKSVAAVLAGTDSPLTTGYSYVKSVFEYDPNTSVAWTKAGFEAAKLRLEKSL